jgi:hypothetical protein
MANNINKIFICSKKFQGEPHIRNILDAQLLLFGTWDNIKYDLETQSRLGKEHSKENNIDSIDLPSYYKASDD